MFILSIILEDLCSLIQKQGWRNPKITDKLIRDWLKENNFNIEESPSIHSDMSIKFMQEVIQADLFVLSIMKEGVSLDFMKTPPDSYYEKNNKSAIDNIEHLTKKANTWITEGSVVELNNLPSVIL